MNKMNRFFPLGSAILISAGLFVFSACSDDDDPIYDGPTIVSEFEVDFDDDILELCDVNIRYVDFTGVSKVYKLIDGDWKNNQIWSTFPARLSYKIEVIRKANVPLVRASYDIEADVEFEATGYDIANKYIVCAEDKQILSNREDVPAAEVEVALSQLISKVNALNLVYNFSLSPAGYIEYVK